MLVSAGAGVRVWAMAVCRVCVRERTHLEKMRRDVGQARLRYDPTGQGGAARAHAPRANVPRCEIIRLAQEAAGLDD